MLDNWTVGGAAHADRITAWLARAEALHDHAINKGDSVSLPFTAGSSCRVSRRHRDRQRAVPPVARHRSSPGAPGRRPPPARARSPDGRAGGAWSASPFDRPDVAQVAPRSWRVDSPLGPDDSRARELADAQQELLDTRASPASCRSPARGSYRRGRPRPLRGPPAAALRCRDVLLRGPDRGPPKARFSPATMPARSSSRPSAARAALSMSASLVFRSASIPLRPPAYPRRSRCPIRVDVGIAAWPDAAEPADDSPRRKERPLPPGRRERGGVGDYERR